MGRSAVTRVVHRIDPPPELMFWRAVCAEPRCGLAFSLRRLTEHDAMTEAILHSWDHRHRVDLIEVVERA